MIYGAILAGGIGKRIEKHSIPKQFINIGGVPIIVQTLRQFVENKNLDIIYVAVHKDWIDYSIRLFNDCFSESQISRIRIVAGGSERLDSFVNIVNDVVNRTGLNEDDILICHDSVRPFVRQQMIDDCIVATREHLLALTVTPVTDTIHTTSQESEMIDGTLDRTNLYNGQTPSGFNLKLLYESISCFDETEKKSVTGTTQLMLKLGYKIKKVTGHTSNFKITTDNDLEVAERIMRSQSTRRKIEILDCTLRDGGIVINFDFGLDRMVKIKNTLESAHIDYIETGYINKKTGSPIDRTCFDNEQSIKTTLLADRKKQGTKYLAIIDHGTFDLDSLQYADELGIDGIRYAFHKENMREALTEARKILDKGYELFIQPMVTTRYNDEEFRQMISICNNELSEATAFYVVDSFGQMDNMQLIHKLEIADQCVSESMKIGFHGHNNRQMAFSNAQTLIGFPSKHDLIIDSSIMGMGKGAGNVCTELIIPIVDVDQSIYSTTEIYQQINDYIAGLQHSHPWGYNLDYYLSSLYGCTPSYIKIFTKDNRVTTDVLVDLLKNMPLEKRAACDKDFAQRYITAFFEKNG